MKISYLVKTSFIDYKHYISAVLFTAGCNMNCVYCHNQDLEEEGMYIDESEIFAFLTKRQGILDAVVISGGEPTLQPDLIPFLKKLRGLDLKIKLDTNGTRPEVIKTIIQEGLVDYIAMDIKGTSEKYKLISGVDSSDVEESIQHLRAFASYEFRTTVYPLLSLEDIEDLCYTYRDDPYFLQQYRKISDNGLVPYDNTFLQEVKGRHKLRGVL